MSYPGAGKSKSVSVRKIDNGWIKSTSVCDGENYSSSEEFCPTEPKLDAGGGDTTGDTSLARAMRHVKGG